MVTIGVVWDRTTAFLNDHLQMLLPIALGAVYVPLCIQSSIAPLALTAPPSGRAMLIVARLLLTVWMLWGQLAIIALALDPPAGRGEASATATQRLLPVLAVGIVIAIGFAVLTMPMFVALAMSGFDFRAAMAGGHPAMPTGGGGSVAFALLYGLVFLIVLAVIAPRLVLSSTVVVAERRWLSAIPRSWQLTQGLWLRILGVVVLYFVVAWVAQMAATFVFGSVLRIVFGGDGAMSLASVLTAIVVGVVATIFAVLQSAFLAKLYLAVAAAREGAAFS